MYYTCIDMLSVILHYLSGGDQGILTATGASPETGSKRDKAAIERKIRKEIGDSDHPQYTNLRQLIPVPKEHVPKPNGPRKSKQPWQLWWP